MRILLLLLAICFCCLPSEAAKAVPKSKAKAAGVCKDKLCATKAQSGYDGYCKKCFGKKFPQAYAEKVRQRLKNCAACGEAKELQPSGLCKPCTKARSCELCGEVNVASTARTCPSCETVRSRLGATRTRLAMWCLSCFSEQQRASGKCFQCFQCTCEHCGKDDVEMGKEYKCSEKECGAKFSLCVVCYASFGGKESLQYKSC